MPWAEIVLAVICGIVGLIAIGAAIVVLWANAIGGVTNAAAVNNWPALVLFIVAIAAFVGAGLIVIY